MYITRRQVLSGIRYEPLKSGNWVDTDGCSVCAVGAALRRAGLNNCEVSRKGHNLFCIGEVGDAPDSFITSALLAGHYLRALSIKFETLAATYGAGKRTRTILAKWVKKNLPVRFKAEV